MPTFEPGRTSKIIVTSDALRVCPVGREIVLNAEGEPVTAKYADVLAKAGQLVRLIRGRSAWSLWTGYFQAAPFRYYAWDISVPPEWQGLPVAAGVSETGDNGLPFIGEALIYTYGTMVDVTGRRIKVFGGHQYGTNLNIAAGLVISQ